MQGDQPLGTSVGGCALPPSLEDSLVPPEGRTPAEGRSPEPGESATRHTVQHWHDSNGPAQVYAVPRIPLTRRKLLAYPSRQGDVPGKSNHLFAESSHT